MIGFIKNVYEQFRYNQMTCVSCKHKNKLVDWPYQKCENCEEYLYDERQ